MGRRGGRIARLPCSARSIKARLRLVRRRRRQKPAGLLDQAGQSTLEFALTLFLLMAFLLFYVQLALMMGYGNYAHYATFMAARAYLAAGPSKSDQTERAKAVITRMIKRGPGQETADRFPSIARAEGGGDIKGVEISEPGNFSPTDTNLSWLQGVRYSFKSRLFTIPVGTGPAASGGQRASEVILKSESWLGREPSFQDCQGELKGKGIFDNGC